MASRRAEFQSGWYGATVGVSIGISRLPSSTGRRNSARSARSFSRTLSSDVNRSARNFSYWPRVWEKLMTLIVPASYLALLIRHVS